MSVDLKIANIMANDAQICALHELKDLLQEFNFHKKFKIITVAGTNGKGTAVTMLEELLVANNKSVLSHTSPHVFKFNERISLNKKPIDEVVLLEILERLAEISHEYKLSYYQIAFLSACMYSQKIHVDYLILEVGIGGRLDAANLLEPDITAITNIDFDHCEILGDTLDKIGREKVGICRSQIPLFLGSKMPESVYLYAKEVGAIIYEKNYEYESVECFTHSHNIAMAIAEYLLHSLAINYAPRLEHIKAPARFYQLKSDSASKSYVIVDVAHNPASVKHLFSLLEKKAEFHNLKYEAVFGILGSKDIEKVLDISKQYVNKWNVVNLKCVDARALDIDDIRAEFEKQNIVMADYHQDLTSLYLAKKNTVTVVFGSFVMAGKFLEEYNKNS
ncbi:bifunctional folylpolyglutamate synthase/dihydrofolate synthase [Francisella sp. Scap27]|uniref:bifunctional folylpolyglutamate synthase/dihydrofolate synthase n=1 Tax=Francisella sp. Scap27 TaxID=2589986 RepID=UPI0015BAF272|nr:Mur ligase family protein [Francisella sp. Scap27]QLE78946.1 bifunctional folylpolyglutamate synthase/dihydrofolate synthase [Francisella sp. Scap27]